MRIADRGSEIISSVEATGFNIKASAKAFRVLSSSLYNDKIGSIVRELASNCRDAHVSIGSREKFKIQLPTRLDPEVSFIDKGPGISKEGVYTVLTTYFESSKTDSDDYIGAMGLGFKSPFSYSDLFSVTSKHGGVRSEYACMISSETGVPSISLLFEEPCGDETGLTIKIPCAADDHHKWANAVHTQLWMMRDWFEVDPNEHWLDFDPSDFGVEKDGVILWLHGAPPGRPKKFFGVSMGDVIYPIDPNNYPRIKPIVEKSFSVIVKIGIGDVEPNASREGLQYTSHTIDNLDKAVDRFKSVIDQEFDEIKSSVVRVEDMNFVLSKISAPSDRTFRTVAGNIKLQLEDVIGGGRVRFRQQHNLFFDHDIDEDFIIKIGGEDQQAWLVYGMGTISKLRSVRAIGLDNITKNGISYPLDAKKIFYGPIEDLINVRGFSQRENVTCVFIESIEPPTSVLTNVIVPTTTIGSVKFNPPGRAKRDNAEHPVIYIHDTAIKQYYSSAATSKDLIRRKTITDDEIADGKIRIYVDCCRPEHSPRSIFIQDRFKSDNLCPSSNFRQLFEDVLDVEVDPRIYLFFGQKPKWANGFISTFEATKMLTEALEKKNVDQRKLENRFSMIKSMNSYCVNVIEDIEKNTVWRHFASKTKDPLILMLKNFNEFRMSFEFEAYRARSNRGYRYGTEEIMAPLYTTKIEAQYVNCLRDSDAFGDTGDKFKRILFARIKKEINRLWGHDDVSVALISNWLGVVDSNRSELMKIIINNAR